MKKPKLGQNFLVDTEAQRRIVEALGPAVRGAVVEIGPGKAAITSLLAARARRLFAIELDPLLAAGLRSRFALQVDPGERQVTVIEADVLTVDLYEIAAACLVPGSAEPAGRSLAVIGNLPYYITSPILQHLFTHEAVISRAVVMVQREVAERMTAEPGSRDYGLLSVLCQLYAQTELLFVLPPAAFAPPPAVHSAIVRLEFAPKWSELGLEPKPFTRFLGQCFAQKRKTLRNNLLAAGYSAEEVVAATTAGRVDAGARAEALHVDELAAVSRSLVSTV
jgi:16S rRNA (adenine1518-N6/adenine1519-N6)-dimethyltransferase